MIPNTHHIPRSHSLEELELVEGKRKGTVKGGFNQQQSLHYYYIFLDAEG